MPEKALIVFNERERTTAEEVVHRMVKRAIEMEGTVTGEHGVGLIKRDYLDRELGESTVDLMRKVRPTPPFHYPFFLHGCSSPPIDNRFPPLSLSISYHHRTVITCQSTTHRYYTERHD